MICETCQREGTRSNVYPEGGFRTLMVVNRYWDADGVEHVHDGNVYTEGYHCSEGHAWTIRRRRGCTACGQVDAIERTERDPIPLGEVQLHGTDAGLNDRNVAVVLVPDGQQD